MRVAWRMQMARTACTTSAIGSSSCRRMVCCPMEQSCECRQERTRFDLLASPGVLFGLSLLLLNDFFLKRYAHSALSGKLSDFAGLFVFPLFCVTFLPRFRTPIYVLVAALFVVWKSSYSQQLIEIW